MLLNKEAKDGRSLSLGLRIKLEFALCNKARPGLTPLSRVPQTGNINLNLMSDFDLFTRKLILKTLVMLKELLNKKAMNAENMGN